MIHRGHLGSGQQAESVDFRPPLPGILPESPFRPDRIFGVAGRQRPSCCLLPAVLLHAGSLHHRFTAWWFRVRSCLLPGIRFALCTISTAPLLPLAARQKMRQMRALLLSTTAVTLFDDWQCRDVYVTIRASSCQWCNQDLCDIM